MNQISARSDKTLHKLSREIGEGEALIEAGTRKKDNAWESVFEFFDEHGLDGKEARFIADDGHYLQRQERTASPKLDEEQLHAQIFRAFPEAKAKKIWDKITVRKVDSVNLEAAVQMGMIPADMVNQCITPGKKSFARVRNEWTKEDKEKAQIFGIEKGA